MIAIAGTFHFKDCFASGSYYIPFKKVTEYDWKSSSLINKLFSWSFPLTQVHLVSYDVHPTKGKTFFAGILNSYFILKKLSYLKKQHHYFPQGYFLKNPGHEKILIEPISMNQNNNF